MGKLYEKDFFGWTVQQADALRRRSVNEIDWDNLIEEVESLGRSERRELQSRLEVLYLHLLKWAYQPSLRSRSWSNTIDLQRARAREVIDENPGLAPRLVDISSAAYRAARAGATNETGLAPETLPLTSPFTMDDALSDSFLPETSP